MRWIKQSLRALFRSFLRSGAATETRRRESADVYPRLYDTQLEPRRVLNADLPPGFDPQQLVFSAGEEANDGRADHFELSTQTRDGQREVVLKVNERAVWTGDESSVSRITLEGSSDADTFSLAPDILLSGGVRIVGGSNNDQVVFASLDASRYRDVTYQSADGSVQVVFAASSAELNVPATRYEIAGVERVRDAVDAESRTVELAGDGTNWLMSSTAPAVDGTESAIRVTDETNGLSIVFNDPGRELNIDTRDADGSGQNVRISSWNSSPTGKLFVFGDEADTLMFDESVHLSAGASVDTGAITVRGALDNSSGDINLSALRNVSVSGRVENASGNIRIEAPRAVINGDIVARSSGTIWIDSGFAGMTTVAGKLSAAGSEQAVGGKITILGRDIEVLSSAVLNVSGGYGGGSIHVGRADEGSSTGTRSQTIRIESGAVLNADALSRGDGGRIILFSDDYAQYQNVSTITARGGQISGNGGFIETSAVRKLDMRGAVNARAAAGEYGTWLVDPNDVLLVETLPGLSPLNTTYILIDDVISALDNVGTYVINTQGQGGGGSGDIILVNALNYSGLTNSTLILSSDNDIRFFDSVTGNGRLSLNLSALGSVDSSGQTLGSLNSLSIIVPSGDATLGNVSVTGTSTSGISIASSTINLLGSVSGGGHDVRLTATSTSLTAIQAEDIDTEGGDLTIQTSGGVQLNGVAGSVQSSTSGAALFLKGQSASAAMQIGGSAVSGFRLSDTAFSAIGTGFTGGIQIGAVNQSGTITIAGTDKSFAGPVTILANGDADVMLATNIDTTGAAGSNDFRIQAGSGSVTTLRGNLSTNGGDVTVTAGQFLVHGVGVVQRTIDSAASLTPATQGGNVDLGNVSSIDGTNSAASLRIVTGGTQDGGSVTLADVVTAVRGLYKLEIDSSAPISDGLVTLGDVRLVLSGATSPSLTVNKLDTTPRAVLLKGAINVSSSSNTVPGGTVDFGTAVLTPTVTGATLTISAANDAPGGDDGGNVKFGGAGSSASGFFARVIVDVSAAAAASTDGTITIGGNSPTIATQGSASDISSSDRITLIGTVSYSGSGPLTLQTNGAGSAASSGRINIVSADFIGGGALVLDTSGFGHSTNAGDVLLGQFGATALASGLTIDTRGTSSDGVTFINDQNSGTTTTTLKAAGPLDLTHTSVSTGEHVSVIITGTGGDALFGDIDAAGTNKNFTIAATGSAQVGQTNLHGGTLSVRFDTDNSAAALFRATGDVTVGIFDLEGQSRSDVTAVFDGQVTTTTGKLEVTLIGSVQFLSAITSQLNVNVTGILDQAVFSGSISAITNVAVSVSSGAGRKIELIGDIISRGGIIDLNGGVLLIDGSAARSIKSGGNALDVADGGLIDLTGLAGIDGIRGPASLAVDSRGSSKGGAVKLADVIAASSGINNLLIRSDGTTDGQVTLKDIRLVQSGATPALLRVNNTDATPLAVKINGDIDLSTASVGVAGGTVDFGTAVLIPTTQGDGLSISTANTSTAGNAASIGGNILFGSISTAGSDYFGAVRLDSLAYDGLAASGTIDAQNAAPVIEIDGSATDVSSVTGIQLRGRLNVDAGDTLTIRTNATDGALSSKSIDAQYADFIGGGDVKFDTAGGGLSTSAGSVYIGDIGASVQPGGLVIDTRGSVSQGKTVIDDGVVGSQARIRVGGSIDFTKTITRIADDAFLSAEGGGSTAKFDNIESAGTDNDLRIEAAGTVQVDTTDIQNGTLTIRVDSDDSGADSFLANSTVSAGSVSLSGSVNANADAVLMSLVTSTQSDVEISQFKKVDLRAGITSARDVKISSASDQILVAGTISAQRDILLALSAGIGNNITLKGDLTSHGGQVALSGGDLLIDGTAKRTIRSGGSAVNVSAGGRIDLTGVDQIAGTGAAAALSIDSRGTASGGDVLLAQVTGASSGINHLEIRSDATVDGQVTLSDVRLVRSGTTAALLEVNKTDATPTDVIVKGSIDLSTSVSIVKGGTADFGTAFLAPVTDDTQLNIKTNNSNATVGALGGGDVKLGGVRDNAGAYFATVTIDTQAAATGATAGTVTVGGTAPSIGIRGSNSDVSSVDGIKISGKVSIGSGSNLVLETNAAGTAVSSRRVDITATDFRGGGGVIIDTSGGGNSTDAGDVLLGRFGFTQQPSRLSIDTTGTATFGVTTVNDNDVSGSTQVLVAGPIDLSHTITRLADGVLFRATGTGNIILGEVGTDGSARNLQLESNNSAQVGVVQLQGGTLNVSIDNNSDGTAAFLADSTINAGSVLITGHSQAGVTAEFTGAVTTTSDITLNNLGAVAFQSGVSSGRDLLVTAIADTIVLNGTTAAERNVTLTVGSGVNDAILLIGDLISSGGKIDLNGSRLLIDGAASRSIKSGGTAVNKSVAGDIDLTGLTAVDGTNGVASLVVDSRGSTTAGNISLAPITATGSGLNSLSVRSDATNDGQVTLAGVRLVQNGLASASLQVNAGDASPTAVRLNGSLDLSTTTVGVAGGAVDFGSAVLTPVNGSSTLTIDTRNLNLITGDDGSDGGLIRFGSIGANGAAYFDSVQLDSGTEDSLDTAGLIQFRSASAPSVAVDGDSGGDSNLVGIMIRGRVDFPSGGTVNLQSNPGHSAGLRSRAIDVRQAAFLSGYNLTIDTSGAGTSLQAGNIFVGDLGVGTAVGNLLFDTRGATRGAIVLDDGDGSTTPTVLRSTGNIDFSGQTLRAADDVEIYTSSDAGTLAAGNVVTDGPARNLTLTSDGSVSIGTSDLNGGNLSVSIDADDDQVGATFTNTGSVTAGTFFLTGNASQNDSATIAHALTTTAGNILFDKLDRLTVADRIQSAGWFSVVNISTAVDLAENAQIFAVDQLNMDGAVGDVRLTGTGSSSVLLDVTGNTGSASIIRITGVNASADVSIRADYGVNIGDIDTPDADVNILFSRNTTRNDAYAITGSVEANKLTIRGADRLADFIALGGTALIHSGGLSISHTAIAAFFGDVNSESDLSITQVSDQVVVLEFVDITGTGNFDAQTDVRQITLSGASGTPNRLEAVGNTAVMKLGNVLSLNGVQLTLVSAGDMFLKNVDMTAAGTLDVRVHSSAANVSNSLSADSILAGNITASGSNLRNDTATFSSTIRAAAGDTVFTDFRTLRWEGDVTATGQVTVSGISDAIEIARDTLVRSESGDLNLATSVHRVSFDGGAGAINTIDALVADVLLPDIVSSSAGASLAVTAGRNVVLDGSNVAGSMSVVAAAHGGALGTINNTGTVAVGVLTLESATGIGTSGDFRTATGNISAANRISGNIQIANQRSAETVIQSLSTVIGGNTIFRQSGGGAARFMSVDTGTDADPTQAENTILLTVDGAQLIIDGTGINSTGLGNIRLETDNSGDIRFSGPVQANAALVIVDAAGNIVGTGQLNTSKLDLTAVGSIGVASPLEIATREVSAVAGVGSIRLNNSGGAPLGISNLRTLTGEAITFVQSGSGVLELHDVTIGPGGTGDFDLRTTQSNQVLKGNVRVLGRGSVLLHSAGDLVLDSTSVISTTSSSALIVGEADGVLHLNPGAVLRAGTEQPQTEAVLTQLPPPFVIVPQLQANAFNVSNDGTAGIFLSLIPSGTGVLDQNYSIVIDWGGGQIDRYPFGPISANSQDPGITRFDSSPVPYLFVHQYFENPNAADPTANINVHVSIGVDALGRIRLADSQAIEQNLNLSSTSQLQVPGSGFYSLVVRLPDAPTVQKQFLFTQVETASFVTTVPVTENSTDPSSAVTAETQTEQQRYELRLVSPVDDKGRTIDSEGVELSPEQMNDLGSLFKALSDNRYRIVLIMEDGNEFIIKDFVLKNHVPTEIEETPAIERELPFDNRNLDSMIEPGVFVPQVNGNTGGNDENASVAALTLFTSGAVSGVDGPRSLRKAARRIRSAFKGSGR